jgi:hypothetical protein
VPGYPGSAELRLATERGELDGDGGAWGAISPEWLEGKKINPIVPTAPIVPPDMPKDVPYVLRLPVMPRIGEEAITVVEAIYAAPKNVVDEARKLAGN